MRWDILTPNKKDGGFGFREMESFNLTLLTKLSWKIITELESLYAKVLKGIYFTTCSQNKCDKRKIVLCQEINQDNFGI